MTTVKIRTEHNFEQVRNALSSTSWPVSNTQDALGRWYQACDAVRPRCAWLAFYEEKLIGLASVSDPVEGSGGRPVVDVFVSPGQRRRGLGRALVTRALRAYPCLAADHQGTHLYEKMGIGEIKPFEPPAPESDPEERCRFVQAQLSKNSMHRRRHHG